MIIYLYHQGVERPLDTGALSYLPFFLPPGGGSVHFVSQGEVRLAELKQLLSRAGEQTEFVDGALVVNSTVKVRKDGAQRLLIEGAYGEDYLRVRELLYGQVQAI